jgi:hypothetical protein
VPDHQNCRARGCHAGRADYQGFPIPHIVPAIISTTGKLPSFSAPEQPFQFLCTTHPLQHHGYLLEDKYWAISAYLLEQNERLAPGQVLGPQGIPGQ